MNNRASKEDIVTLATSYDDRPKFREPDSPGSKDVTRALVIASSSRGQIGGGNLAYQVSQKIGDQSIISHCLHQLALSGITNCVVVVGRDGENVKAAALEDPDDEYGNFQISFVELGAGFTGTFAESVVAGSESFAQDGEEFLLITADTIFEVDILQELTGRRMGLPEGDVCRVVVETDTAGMVGVTSNFMFVGTRTMDSPDRIFQMNSSLAFYNGIATSLYRCSPEILPVVDQVQKRMPFKDAFEDVLSGYASTAKLVMMSTHGRTWFAVESQDAIDFTTQSMNSQLTKIGEAALSDSGIPFRLTGLPRNQQRAKDGGDWAEFDVGKWRNAVFKAKAFHAKLYDDTTDFIKKCGDMLGGANRCAVVEVGCGTGEALMPLRLSFKYCVGIDFNQRFIDFCNTQVQEGMDNLHYIAGDACELGNLLDAHPVDYTGVPKVVTCVGNTIGIMPDEIKPQIYREMARVAGQDGIAVMVFWNGNKFGDALQHFYHANPQLCGPFTGESIDLDTCTLRCPSGYTTHWTKPDEAREVIEGYGLEVISVEESSDCVGVLTSFREPRP